MSKEKNPSQSLSISGGNLSEVQIAQGNNVNQTQIIEQSNSEKILSSTEIIKLIEQLEALLKNSSLSDDKKLKATRHIAIIKDEVASKSPDKGYATKTLQKLLEVITTVQEIWEKSQPIIKEMLPWFGVTAMFLGF